jgi:hypothetical protein
MILAGFEKDPSAYRSTSMLPAGAPIHAVHLISDPREQGPKPHAFLVSQEPGTTLAAHFHRVAQFQVVVGGSGVLGRHEIAPYTVHFSAAETGYGPIVAGPDGLGYLTLRQITKMGVWYLPVETSELSAGLKRRQATSSSIRPAGTGLAALAEVERRTLLPREPTGLEAWLVRLPPGASVVLGDHPGSDRYYVVAAGCAEAANQQLPAMAVLWVSREEPAQAVTAGNAGAEIVVVQFPVTVDPDRPLS